MNVHRFKSISIFCVVAIVLCLSLPGYLQSQNASGEPAAAAAPPVAGTYIIQPSDVLEIFVWKEPDLSRKSAVRPDGRISFPLIQDLVAAGHTAEDLKKEIEMRLTEYVTRPNVTVLIDTIQGHRLFVIGKVQRPGPLVTEKPLTVLQALTLAGGFLEYAKSDEITIIRNAGENSEVLKFSYPEVIKGRKAAENVFLKPGDVVVVP
jgi:polysaccharide export outer membrane protein